MLAIRAKSWRLFDILINTKGLNLEEENNYHQTALFVALESDSGVTHVKRLLEAGAHFDKLDRVGTSDDGFYFLASLIERGEVEMLRWVLA